MARRLDGAVVAVVGSTGGLGRAIAERLTATGAVVVGASRTVDEHAGVRLDVRDAAAGDHLVAVARERHGRLDGVVVASGAVAFGVLADTDDVVAEELMLVNALGPLWLARRSLPSLAEHGGFFAAISGVVAETPQAGMAAYSMSKAALSAGLTAIRREFRRNGVAVLDARPPHTETGLATRPIAGTAPRFPEGLAPSSVADRIVAGIEADEAEIPAAAFA